MTELCNLSTKVDCHYKEIVEGWKKNMFSNNKDFANYNEFSTTHFLFVKKNKLLANLAKMRH